MALALRPFSPDPQSPGRSVAPAAGVAAIDPDSMLLSSDREIGRT
jgi:hypothetical protein